MTTILHPTRRLLGLVAVCLSSCIHTTRDLPGFASMPDPTHPGRVQSATKTHLVWVRPFRTSWGGDPYLAAAGTTLTQHASRVVAARVDERAGVQLDDPPGDAPNEFELRGLFTGSTREVAALELELVARDGTQLAVARRELDLPEGSAPDAPLLRDMTDELTAGVAGWPWSAAVLESSQRLLVCAANPDSGLTVNELLVVRMRGVWQRDSSGRIGYSPGQEVARVYVDAFLERDGRSRGVYCRLWGGSFSGFEPDEIVVEEP